MFNRKAYSLTRIFGNLKVRPKLMVLHNLFFLVLTCAAYFSLIPLFEKLVADARAREVAIQHLVAHVPADLKLSQESYRAAVDRARLTLFLVLGSIYVLAVLVLESAIMPLYVYRPLRKMIMRSRNATVTTLRRQEDELAAALKRLEEQDRLVSLGLLSASVAHELNTPLAVLNGSIEKLMETTVDAHTLERLQRMQRVAQRCGR